MTRRLHLSLFHRPLFVAAVLFGSLVGYVWLVLWAAARDQRFFVAREDRHWERTSHTGLAEEVYGPWWARHD